MSDFMLPRFEDVAAAFNRDALADICAMHETDFAATFGLDVVPVDQKAPDNFYCFQDNGSAILGVAHLDTVGLHDERAARFVETEAGEVVFSRALDDRLGAYVLLDLLPQLGIVTNVLLTTGEESGNSTAGFFDADGVEHNWGIEFDRGGTDVVMYQYEDDDLCDRVRASGARVGEGIFSDIGWLEHLEIKCLNWGVGYRDYHGPRAHAFLDDTFEMVSYFLRFHEANAGIYLPHEYQEPVSKYGYGSRRSTSNWWDEPDERDVVWLSDVEDEDPDADLLADLGEMIWPSTDEAV